MKYITFVIVGLLLGLQSMAQGPVRKYNDDIYSVDDMKRFALGKSDTAKAFAKFILDKCQKEFDRNNYKVHLDMTNLPWLFDSCIFIEEVDLKKGNFENSNWDRKNKNLHFFLSNIDYAGMAGVFKYGRCYDELWKGNCGNGLNVPKSPIVKAPPIEDKKKEEPKIEPKPEPKEEKDEETPKDEESDKEKTVQNITYVTVLQGGPNPGGQYRRPARRFTGYVSLNVRRRQNYRPPRTTTSDPRTMSQGVPSTGGNNGGVSSDPRGMSGGIH